MKTMNKTLGWMLAAVMSLALVTHADAQDAKQRTGKVVRIKGDARYSTGNKVWQPLKVGIVLKSGYIVQTAMSSFVDIVVNEEESAQGLKVNQAAMKSSSSASSGGGGGGATPSPDQDVVRVLDDTYVIFDALKATTTGEDTVTETMIDLRKGSLFGSVKKQAAASRFEIKTPNGVAGIRGTSFLIKANGDLACLVGSVIAAFTDSAGNVATQVVNAGEQFSAGSGQVGAIAPGAMGTMSDMMSQTGYSSASGGTTPNPPNRPPGRPPYGQPGWAPAGDHVSNHKPR